MNFIPFLLMYVCVEITIVTRGICTHFYLDKYRYVLPWLSAKLVRIF
jgi:hypothetical protein